MSDPRRLFDDGGEGEMGGMGRDLLRSARGDAPSQAARRRTAVALGLAAGVAATTTASTAAAAASASKWGAYSGAAMILKWIGIGALGGVMVVSAVEVTTSGSTRGSTTSATPNVTENAGSANTHAPRQTRDAIPAPVADPAPVVTPAALIDAPKPASNASPASNANTAASANAPSFAASPASPPSPVPSAPTTLADEVSALDHARSMLAAGDTNGALTALDTHDRAFSSGALAPEAAVLRIEALAQRGDDKAATSRANAFLAAYPGAPQARRVQSVLADIKAKNP